MSPHARGAWFAALSSFIGGANSVACRALVETVPSIAIAFWRFAIAAAILACIALATKRTLKRPGSVTNLATNSKDIALVVFVGLLQYSVFAWAYTASTGYTTAVRATLVLATIPLTTLVVSSVLRLDKLTTIRLFAVLTALTGVAIALSGKAISTRPLHPWLGELVMLIGTFASVAHNLIAKPLLAKFDLLWLTVLEMVVGLCVLVAVGATTGWLGWFDFTPQGWVLMIAMGIFGSALTHWMWMVAIRDGPPVGVAVSVCLNPIAALLAGTVFLNEPATLTTFVGLLFIAAGVYLANRR
jgi:drug/metabolite transporter (DMT)-like permease